MSLSDSPFSPGLNLTVPRLVKLSPFHCLGPPMLTACSSTYLPAPLPRCSSKMLFTLSSPGNFGLRLTRTVSAFTLGFSRLARRSIFILACTLADPLKGTFSIAGSGVPIARFASTTASGGSVRCRVGFLPPTGIKRPFMARPSLSPYRSRLRIAPSPCRSFGLSPIRLSRAPGSFFTFRGLKVRLTRPQAND
jgi:hypothetical protein